MKRLQRLLLLVLFVFLCGCAPGGAAAPTWRTMKTFSGLGGPGFTKTAPFTVPGDWRLQWSCTLSPSGAYNFAVFVERSDTSLVDQSINYTCWNKTVPWSTGASKTSGTLELHAGGQLHLEVDSFAAWSVLIQVPQ